MEKSINYLKQLDLSDVEAKLYLTLLQSGPTSVRDLAANIDIKRTTAYFYIDQMVEKGLIIKVVQGSKKLLAASEPKSLEELVEKKLEKAQAVKEAFPTMLESLTTLPQHTEVNEAEIRHYTGKHGVKKIYEEVLKAKEVRSYVNIEEIATVFPDNFPLFDNALKKNPDMVTYEIVENSPQARQRFKSLATINERYSYKFLPEDMKLTAQDIIIYDNKVAIIHFKDKISGIVLKNADLHANFTLLFKIIWKMLPESK